MKVETIVCGPLDVNSYIVYREGASQCLVIDPADAVPIQRRLKANGLTCSHILLTHGHFDHIGGVAVLKQNHNAAVCIHALDADMLGDSIKNLADMMGFDVSPCQADTLLQDGEHLFVAGLSVSVIHTPGHTRGGVCYRIEDTLFTGDTIFRMGAGRADFPGSDVTALYGSIMKLFEIQQDCTLYPGHMGMTSLAFEREKNTFVRHYREFLW